jgi:hypothetical protein
VTSSADTHVPAAVRQIVAAHHSVNALRLVPLRCAAGGAVRVPGPQGGIQSAPRSPDLRTDSHWGTQNFSETSPLADEWLAVKSGRRSGEEGRVHRLAAEGGLAARVREVDSCVLDVAEGVDVVAALGRAFEAEVILPLRLVEYCLDEAR